MKLMKMTLPALCIAVAFSGLPAHASLNTASIMASSSSLSCIDYKIIGTCFWLYCTKFGCVIRTSMKVKHYIPETVISSYNHDGQNPWQEMNQFNQGAKGGEYRSPQKNYTQLTFKNTAAIGHPQGAITQILRGSYYCQSQTKPFVPYFLSSLDFLAWNHGIPEMFYPESLVPGMREIRENGDTWGNIFPRSGAVTQMHDYKASAVTAHRVADFLTRSAQPHIYIPTAKQEQGQNGYWYPEPVKEAVSNNHKWQQLHPKMSQSCSIFPDTPPNMVSEDGSYAWALWRPYKCCKRRGQRFLHSIDWSN